MIVSGTSEESFCSSMVFLPACIPSNLLHAQGCLSDLRYHVLPRRTRTSVVSDQSLNVSYLEATYRCMKQGLHTTWERILEHSGHNMLTSRQETNHLTP